MYLCIKMFHWDIICQAVKSSGSVNIVKKALKHLQIVSMLLHGNLKRLRFYANITQCLLN